VLPDHGVATPDIGRKAISVYIASGTSSHHRSMLRSEEG
jgi:hypothetical protein